MSQNVLGEEIKSRQRWMGVLAKALWDNLEMIWKDFPFTTAYKFLRKAETGLVMVEGRTGGTGAPFNLGETTVTRCSISLQSGEIGHAYVMGRNHKHAEIAAVCDALMQSARHDEVDRNIINPLEKFARSTAAKQSAKVAATKVDFFTVVRGEDV